MTESSSQGVGTKKEEEMKSSSFGLFRPMFQLLNYVAFVGWMYVLYQLLVQQTSSRWLLLGLEGICFLEVMRILVGDIKGNFVLGIVLHMIRTTIILIVLPVVPTMIQNGILWSWSITEVARYPMYIFYGNSLLRNIRLVVPIVTFPIGAISEGYGAWMVLTTSEKPSLFVTCILILVLFINGVLGTLLAYPALLRKGLPILLGKKKKTTPTTTTKQD